MEKGAYRILLCGFMGSGKTSIGQALAFRLRWDFVDTDLMIEKRQKKSIPQIFQQQGEEAFRQMEAETAKILGRRKRVVISTGGGFMTRPETIEALKKSSGGFDSVVFLDCSFETCYQRIRVSDRPLVRQNTREGLREIFDRRRELYLKAADAVIPNEGTIGQTVEKILQEVNVL